MSDLLDFTIEMNCTDAVTDELEQELFVMADKSLRALTKGHSDLRGAAINVRLPADRTTPPLYEATVALYVRPKQIAATEKHHDVVVALKGALDAVERQLRQQRAKLTKRWQQPGKGRIAKEMKLVEAETESFEDGT